MTDEIIPGNPLNANPDPQEKRKVSKSETGHAKNVANFQDLKSFCISYGPTYNPSNPAITVPSLNTKYTDGINALKGVDDLIPAWINAIDDREIIFNPLSKLITRVYNSLSASGASQQFIEDALTIVRKIQGRRAKAIPKPSDIINDPGKTPEEIHNYISSSQTSMDNRIENFYKLIQLLISQSLYAPNETELQTASLTTLLTNMQNSNTDVIDTYAPLSNARIARDKVLYHPETGLVHIALEVKKYVKSVFGAQSAQYLQVSKIKFKGGTDLANKVK
jgi:hypothetical protein